MLNIKYSENTIIKAIKANLEKFLLSSLLTRFNMQYKGIINNAFKVSSIRSYHSICPIISIPLAEVLIYANAVLIVWYIAGTKNNAHNAIHIFHLKLFKLVNNDLIFS